MLWHLFDVKTAHAPAEGCAIGDVAIPNHVSGRGIERGRLHHLLNGPLGRRIRGDIEMDDPAAFVGEHDQHVQDFESHCRDDEEVNGHEVLHVAVEKRLPGR